MCTRNNPVRYTDPSGHLWEDEIGGGACAGGGGGGAGIGFLYLLNKALDVAHQYGQRFVNWGFNFLQRNPDIVNGTVQEPGDVVGAAGGEVAGKAISWVGRFTGADEAILRGVRRLENAMNSAKWPPYRYGYEKQLERAYQLYREGKLKSVEVLAENGGRYDFVLVTDEVVEFKYWTQSTVSKRQHKLIEQVLRYSNNGQQKVILEFGITKTNPIDPAYLDKLRQAFAERGLTDIEIRLISVGAP